MVMKKLLSYLNGSSWPSFCSTWMNKALGSLQCHKTILYSHFNLYAYMSPLCFKWEKLCASFNSFIFILKKEYKDCQLLSLYEKNNLYSCKLFLWPYVIMLLHDPCYLMPSLVCWSLIESTAGLLKFLIQFNNFCVFKTFFFASFK